MKKTNIQWADYTWNPWHGCTHVSPGCDNCYMFEEKKRYGQDPKVVSLSKTKFDAPIKKGRDKEYKIPPGSKVFVCSWSDFFHPLADQWRADAWAIIKQRPDVVFIIVTKRTHRIEECLPPDWGEGYPNVWLVVSVENNEMRPRVHKLQQIPAKVRGISYEPALEYVDFKPYLWRLCRKCGGAGHLPPDGSACVCAKYSPRPGFERTNTIDWLIIGGESGEGARAFDFQGGLKVAKEGRAAGVAVFWKQLGAQAWDDGKLIRLDHEKGGDINEWPDGHAYPRQFPEKEATRG